MKLPKITQPERYRGLYVYDFGRWATVGYTADEVAVLLESESYRAGKVYKIVRAGPDGQMELRGVSAERFQLESGMFFARDELDPARADFAELQQLARRDSPPCRAVLHLADRGRRGGVSRYVTALIYPAEYEDEMAAWLSGTGYTGGDLAEGGISHVSNFYAEENKILEREQLWNRSAIPSRGAAEVLGSVRRTVQR